MTAATSSTGTASDDAVDRSAEIVTRAHPEPIVRYVSASLVYEEHLLHGCYRTRYWSPSAAIKPDQQLRPTMSRQAELSWLDEPATCAFRLSVDGQELWDNWRWRGVQVEDGPTPGSKAAAVTLAHGQRPVTVTVRTRLDGTPLLVRWLEITNTGDRPAAVGAVAPFSGVLFSARRLAENLPSNLASPFTLARFTTMESRRECDFRWQPLSDGTTSFGGFAYGPPFFVVRSEVTGELFVGHLAWSGPYEVELFHDHAPPQDEAWLYVRVALAGPGPLRVLEPGETVSTPAVHLGHVHDGLDAAVQALHAHERRSVLPALPAGRRRPVELNSSIVEDALSEEALLRSIDLAAELGVELFTIDAGWYSDRGTDWWPYVGDWRPGNRLPRGLEPVFDHARRKELLCGLWFDAERMGDQSELYREHQHWLVRRHGRPVPPAQSTLGWPPRALDFTQPEVVAHVEATLCDRIERYQLDVFRLDFNTRIGRADGQTVRHGYTENNAWRHGEAVYAMYERIRRRFPHLLMENCAGGGGRNDLGMLANFHWTQMSDEWGAVRTLKILNGFTLALPPEYGLSYIGSMNGENYRYGDLDFRLRVQLFGHYCLSNLAPSAGELPAAAKARVRHAIDLYKRFVRPMLDTCRVYHHTPVLPNDVPGEWVAFEYVAADGSRAYAGVFRLADAREATYVLRPRGLARGERYRVTFDNSGESVVVDGLELARAGLPVVLDQRLTSELLLFERVA